MTEVQQYLHDELQELGNRAGVYKSVLASGEQVKIGFAAFLPHELNTQLYLKEVLKHFDNKIPIGMKLDWVQMPYDSRVKWNDRQLGIRLWHLFCRAKDAKSVDAELRKWLGPKTVKKDPP